MTLEQIFAMVVFWGEGHIGGGKRRKFGVRAVVVQILGVVGRSVSAQLASILWTGDGSGGRTRLRTCTLSAATLMWRNRCDLPLYTALGRQLTRPPADKPYCVSH